MSEAAVEVRAAVIAKERKARRRKSVGRPDAEQFLAENSTALLYRQKRAVEALREALAPHQPLVQACVAHRLLDRWSHERLSERLALTREQVADILEQMRPSVARHTPFFNDDWHWTDGRPLAVASPVPAR
jgi:hypothetical protein